MDKLQGHINKKKVAYLIHNAYLTGVPMLYSTLYPIILTE